MRPLAVFLCAYCSYPTYEEWKPPTSFMFLKFLNVLILPTRNGNQSLPQTNSHLEMGSYPTYEEWKPAIFVSCIKPRATSSYPTYEEWKHCKIKASNVKLFAVLILPTRNGNCVATGYFQ